MTGNTLNIIFIAILASSLGSCVTAFWFLTRGWKPPTGSKHE